MPTTPDEVEVVLVILRCLALGIALPLALAAVNGMVIAYEEIVFWYYRTFN